MGLRTACFRFGVVMIIVGTFIVMASASPMVLTKANNGKSISMKIGDEVRLELASNATTGYTWTMDQTIVSQGAVTISDSGYLPDAAPEGMVGVGGTSFWVIKAVKAGTYDLKLSYAQPWSNAMPAETFAATLVIGDVTTSGTTEPAGLKVYVNGELLSGTPGPILENGRLYVPLRAMSTALGVEIAWDKVSKKVTAKHGSHQVDLVIGETQAMVDGKVVKTDAAAKIVNGSTYLPLRFVSQAFGAEVNWDAAKQQANITLQ